MRFVMLICFLFALTLPHHGRAQSDFADDGHFEARFEQIAIELVQAGAYGRLTLQIAGFGDLRYGRCRIFFQRDAKGVIAHTPPSFNGTARCPQKLDFHLSPAERGLFTLTFTQGDDLAGHSFGLVPLLRPMQPNFVTKPPQGFDILGLSPGMSRIEIEAALKDGGYQRNPYWSERRAEAASFTQAIEVWSKGQSEADPDQAEETLAITYSTLYESSAPEVALHISRKWNIAFYDQPLRQNLQIELDRKYGATTSGLTTRFYDQEGQFQPQAILPFCSPDIYLRHIRLPYAQEGERGERNIPSACGSWVEISHQPSLTRPDHIASLQIALYRSDLAYEDIWRRWTQLEAEVLRLDYQNLMAKRKPLPAL